MQYALHKVKQEGQVQLFAEDVSFNAKSNGKLRDKVNIQFIL